MKLDHAQQLIDTIDDIINRSGGVDLTSDERDALRVLMLNAQVIALQAIKDSALRLQGNVDRKQAGRDLAEQIDRLLTTYHHLLS